MASNNTNKRRRIAADTLHIGDLPIGFIADVSEYLPKPSRAILAVAFSASSCSWQNENLMHRPSPISKAIISAQQWDILDFEDIEKELANKLTDDDISAVLKSINARDMLKRLKLCGCVNIEGHGLNPLRGSVILEQIDISILSKDEKETLTISKDKIVPILDSIISADGCSLKHINFPWKWKSEHHPPDNALELGLTRSSDRYNQMYNNRMPHCAKCNADMTDVMYDWMSDRCQSHVCYDCLKPFCTDCIENCFLGYCNECDKDFCEDCAPIDECAGCEITGDSKYVCKGCSDRCEECSHALCKDCSTGSFASGSFLLKCNLCKKRICTECSPYESNMTEYQADNFTCVDCMVSYVCR